MLAVLLLAASVTGLKAQDAAKDTVIKGQVPTIIPGRWPAEKAHAWYNQYKWLNGADFIPSTAINQLEMWQADTFDAATIDKELGWAENIGFNTVRVYLHSLAWKQDPKGFKQRMNSYLAIADKHKIKTLFVFFDDCWNPDPKIGKQPAPVTGKHNSGWAQDPGYIVTKEEDFAFLKNYVTDVLTSFKSDKRILLWDLYNEPGNTKKFDASMPLLVKVITWARAVNPEQPLSIGLWRWDLQNLNAVQALNSDVITYHDYEDPDKHLRVLQMLKSHGRPMICTEYMARTNNSTFLNSMPMLKRENVGAINWGLVDGKTNTKYAWNKPIPDGSEPEVWFHEVFRKDGTPYRQEEVDLIKKLNGK
ncbi:1,4-beta-xylanase [Mucilaginibacter hurinus]|uniref:1,4-beta-xylanase n=2 Tax=Mucilaginibacter hurinus TaxID=2201324 RepID=A0A367GS41_9SPHI|nr:1,4-beta-xylanase [Mucilaginibacter hurinus]